MGHFDSERYCSVEGFHGGGSGGGRSDPAGGDGAARRRSGRSRPAGPAAGEPYADPWAFLASAGMIFRLYSALQYRALLIAL